MAQQTQAARAGDVMAAVHGRASRRSGALASATPADVLRAWQGLGYNRRALNLWRAARRIVEVHGGGVPADLAALEALPGRWAVHGACRRRDRVRDGGRRGRHECPPGPRSDRRRRRDGDEPDRAPARGRRGRAGRSAGGMDACAHGPRRDDLRPASAGLPELPGPSVVLPTQAPACQPARRRRRPRDARHNSPSPIATTRWLRGQIVDRLRDASHEDWVAIEAPIGSHDDGRRRMPRCGRWPGRASSSSGTESADRSRADGRPGSPASRSSDSSRRLRFGGHAHRHVVACARARDRALGCRRTIPSSSASICAALRRRWAARAALPAISAEMMTGADHKAQALGYPQERLMEHAGTAVAAAVRALATDLDRWGTGPIVILCGPGNNGGDGYVAARRLALAGARVIVGVVASESRPTGAVAAPELGSDRPRHRDRQGPSAGGPRRRHVRDEASTRPPSSSTPCSGRAFAGAFAIRSGRPSRSSSGHGRPASRSSPSTRRRRSTCRAASRRIPPSGPT